MNRKSILAGIFMLAVVNLLFTTEVIKLEDIKITATKIVRSEKEVPFSVNVVTSDKIEKSPTVTIDEVVRSIAGVHSIRSHPATHGVFVTMRGHALTKQVVALDGQPINDGFNGYVRWGVIPQSIMEKIEVIRGPFSALYGPYSMAGVINFVPKSFVDSNEILMRMDSFAGHLGSLKYGFNLKDKLSVTFFAENKDVQGYVGDFVVMEPKTTQPSGTITDVVGWERTTTPEGKLAYKIGDRGRQYSKEHRSFYTNISWLISPSQQLLISYLYGRQKHGFEGQKTYLKDASGNPVNSGNVRILDNGTSYYLTIRPSNFLDMEGICGQDVVSINYFNQLKEFLKFKVFAGMNTRVQKWAAPLAGATESGGPGRKGTPEGVSYRFGFDTELEIPYNNLLLGVETTFNSGIVKRERLADWKDMNSVTILEEEVRGNSDIYSLYLLDEIKIKDYLSVWAGGRYDSWKNYDSKMITSYTVTSYEDKETSRFSPKLGLLVKPFDFVSIKSSYGEGFRMPTIHELYRQLITPNSVSLENPDLKPEFNTCWEIGAEIYFKKYLKLVKLNYFNDETKDLIYIKKWMAPHPETGQNVEYNQRQNAAEAKTTGLEIEMESKPINTILGIKLSFFANATLQDPKITKNDVDPSIVGKVIPYVPREMYNVGASFEKDLLFITLSAHKRGKVFLKDDNSDVVNGVSGSMDPFNVFDLKVGYKINQNASVSVTANNLFDEKYYSMHNQLAPGRSISGELVVKF